MDFANNNFVLPTHISTLSRYTNNPQRIIADNTLTWTSGAGVANLQWFVPLILPAPYLIASFFVAFGTSPGTGNFECGLFTAPSVGSRYVNKITGTASTACSIGASSASVQVITPSGGSKLVPAGNYYIAYVSSGTTNIWSRAVNTAGPIQSLKGSGVLLGPSASTLSSGSLTDLSNSGSYRFPIFGVSRFSSGY
jgi:hypothetical protein